MTGENAKNTHRVISYYSVHVLELQNLNLHKNVNLDISLQANVQNGS